MSQSKLKRYLIPITITIIILIVTIILIPISLGNITFPPTTDTKPNIPTITSPYSTPELLWTQNIDRSVSDLVVADGVIYINAAWRGLLYAFNATDHTKMWTYGFGIYDKVAPPAIANNIVYVQTTSIFYALNATNGTKIWTYDAEGDSSPVVVDDIVYFGSASSGLNTENTETQHGVIFALNATNGTTIWTYQTNDASIKSVPVVANNIVYIASGRMDNRELYALNAKNGNFIWKTPIGASYDLSPTVANGIVYIGSEDTLYALNATTGKEIWTYTTNSNIGTPTIEYGVAYVISQDQNIYALNAANGKKLWSYPIGENNIMSGLAVADGVIYIGCYTRYNQALYALSAASGKKLWSYPIGCTTPTITDDTLYISSGNDIYAFTTIKPLKPSP